MNATFSFHRALKKKGLNIEDLPEEIQKMHKDFWALCEKLNASEEDSEDFKKIEMKIDSLDKDMSDSIYAYEPKPSTETDEGKEEKSESAKKEEEKKEEKPNDNTPSKSEEDSDVQKAIEDKKKKQYNTLLGAFFGGIAGATIGFLIGRNIGNK